MKVSETLVAVLLENSVCPEHAAHRGAVKYEQLLMNHTPEPQFEGPEKLHLSERKKARF